MKKTFLLLLCFSIITIQTINAQNEEYRSVVSASVGYSLTGLLVSAIETGIGSDAVSIKSTPTLQLTYDYGINKFFSVGIAAGYQNFDFDIDNYSYTDDSGNEVTESFNADYSRLNVALRPLFHYANNDNLDMYSGFRVGLLNNTINSESTDADADLGLNSGGRFSLGLTAFGMRYYFTDNIGAGIEINVGAPYISCFNLNARF